MKRVLQVASVASMIDQFTRNNISILQNEGYIVDVACNFEFGSTCTKLRVDQLKKELDMSGVKTYNLLFDRKIFNKSNILAYRKLKEVINQNNYEIIHCHSPIGGVITRLAARDARRKGTRVIYTAHGFHFFKGASLLNWLVFFPIEWILSFFTDVLITINQEDYRLACKLMKSKCIEYIPGIGVNTRSFLEKNVEKEYKKIRIGIPKESFLILSVGELNKNKNHRVVIDALSKLNDSNIHYCIAGRGELEVELKMQAKNLGIENQVHLLGFRNDVSELYKIADVFCFPSFREGLSVSLMEAMSASLPVVCSDIRGNVDLIESSGGYLCSPKNSDEFYLKLSKLIRTSSLREQMGKHNEQVVRNFDSVSVDNMMKKIYF